MSGLTRGAPTPTEIVLHQHSRRLEIAFSDEQRFLLSFELLRVYSPSAEVRGHGPGQEVLQTGKREVEITELEAVGHYAVKPVFSDGHDTGIYSWDYLYWLGANSERLWEEYLERVKAAGASRDAPARDAQTRDAPTRDIPKSGAPAAPAAQKDLLATEVRRRQ